MTVYNGSTFQTCALRVWGVWVSMRDFHAATASRDLRWRECVHRLTPEPYFDKRTQTCPAPR
jgi:hypothetical protein